MPEDAPRPPRKPKPYEVNPNDIDEKLLKDDPIDLEAEPLSLAEELAEEINHGRQDEDEFDKIYKKLRETNFNNLADLQKLSMPELIEVARKENLEVVDEEGAQRQDLIFRILKERIKLNGLIYGEGTLEILPDGFGFLRSADYHYISCPDDIYVSPSQIRRFGLKNGVTISGQIRPPKENERYFALLRIEAINYREPNELIRHKDFEDLTAIHPTERIKMETTPDELDTRVTDLITPLGFGQRALIVSPPRAGKTILMQKMAKAALRNYPDLYVIMLLIDERPEEVTDMERQVKGPNCEVISSTFDETSSRHIQVSEIVLEKAKRMVEYGRDVLIFLDSITRLARAWNAECPTGGKIMSGGVDANALQSPKRFFGSARRVEEGGSLTIVATALVDTGSRMDQVIFEEFKGTGNMEIVLDRSLVDRRIWPAIDINASGTRREEMLRNPQDQAKISALRRVLSELNPCDAMEALTTRLEKTESNDEFLENIREGADL
ncbi:MAG: transcription termination factor Rho [Thermoguttaceae bacterium]|nr:transcription termination factor Rho [Thermoguttaceae bacterium]MBQ6617002.1 transcription termination factor Rho [Thermoguttaceae bacterium]